jgi:hypothetical protein
VETKQKDNDTRTNAQSSGLESRHTPGPWKVSGCRMARKGFENPMIECGETHEPLIAELLGQDRAWETKIANARLIAAAPELLEACKAAVTQFEANADYAFSDREVIKAIQSAIAKAEGTISTKGATLAD